MIEQLWYQDNRKYKLLLPLSWIYRCIIALRRLCYRLHIFKTHRVTVPVIVVGNLTVGGTGKTPLVIALVKLLQLHGYHPAVISRGYKGSAKNPVFVDKNSDPTIVGDEPCVIAQHCDVPIVVFPKRHIAAKNVLKTHPEVNIIISDDGLQHYALHRDIEIIVVDGQRMFGNQHCLPAGPLREPLSRMRNNQFIIVNGDKKNYPYSMHFIINSIVNVANPSLYIPIEQLRKQKFIAIAGIGNPDRFFNTLRTSNLHFREKTFPNHHAFTQEDIECAANDIILMTEKDAVKCKSFADERHWFAKGEVLLDESFTQDVLQKLSTTHAALSPHME